MASYISLTQGKTAIVDDCYFEELNKHKWHAVEDSKNWYAKRMQTIGKKRQRSVLMHREILRLAGLMAAAHVDHRDGNGLNNQLDNIRGSTASQNCCNGRLRCTNTSGYRGVSLHKSTGQYQASIQVENKRRYLGIYRTAEEAAKIYDTAARRLHGEFARLNFPDESKAST